MDYLKIINKIAYVFGIILAVFSGLAVFLNYEINSILYTSAAPANFVGSNIIVAALPYVTCAFLSFAVAIITSKRTKEKETSNKEVANQETVD